ncbi:MAG: acyltransferase family protein [Gluconacetobacter diazotrophicus]|nr:acyltransferase family protein [Gluconacetobacter diazotrophicus]
MLRARRTLVDAFDPAFNNFDLIRIVAALAVVVVHAYSLVGVDPDPVSRLLGFGYAGTLAVEVFFVISGFLITRSAEQIPPGNYLLSRVLRIVPGLALVTVFEAYVLGLLFFDGDRHLYLREVAPAHLRNILVFPEVPWIPGVFQKNHYQIVNGSLWTLPVEAFFYLLMPLVASLRRLQLPATVIAWCVCLILDAGGTIGVPRIVADNQYVALGLQAGGVVDMGSFFFAGSLLWQLRRKVPFDRGILLIVAILLWVAHGTASAQAALRVCLPYAVIAVGCGGGAGTRLKRAVGDLSYGTYLFGYPLLNSNILLGHFRLSPPALLLRTLPLVLLAAAISWYLVEKPALRLRRSEGGRHRRTLDGLPAGIAGGTPVGPDKPPARGPAEPDAVPAVPAVLLDRRGTRRLDPAPSVGPGPDGPEPAVRPGPVSSRPSR